MKTANEDMPFHKLLLMYWKLVTNVIFGTALCFVPVYRHFCVLQISFESSENLLIACWVNTYCIYFPLHPKKQSV